ncbi:MAG: hypothetical protein ACAI25_04410 [Planctomycetota bacterium]
MPRRWQHPGGMPTTRLRVDQTLGFAAVQGPKVLPGTIALVVFGWLPMMLLAAQHAYAEGAWPDVVVAFETHARYLLVGPVILLTHRTLHERIVRCVDEFVSAAFIRESEVERYREIAARLHRIGTSPTSAAGCFTVALATVAANPVNGTDAASLWQASVGLTLFRFVLLVLVWRWAVWAIFLARVARFDLALVAAHPDGCGGLGFLSQPSEAFSGAAFAMGALVASACATSVLRDGISFLTYKKEVAVFALLFTMLGILPLTPFTGRLYRLRLRAIREYGAFARDYVARFEAKWVHLPPGKARRDPLGSPDLQSLADLSNSFDIVVRSRPFVAGPRLAGMLALSALLPIAPLFATVMPVDEMLPRLMRLM